MEVGCKLFLKRLTPLQRCRQKKLSGWGGEQKAFGYFEFWGVEIHTFFWLAPASSKAFFSLIFGNIFCLISNSKHTDQKWIGPQVGQQCLKKRSSSTGMMYVLARGAEEVLCHQHHCCCCNFFVHQPQGLLLMNSLPGGKDQCWPFGRHISGSVPLWYAPTPGMPPQWRSANYFLLPNSFKNGRTMDL